MIEVIKYLSLSEIEEVFHSYFQSLFQSSNPSKVEIDLCLNVVNLCVTPIMNDHLQAPFTSEEAYVTLKQMVPLKLPGPDGYNACFFWSYWSIVGIEVCNAVLQFLNEGMFEKDLNFT